MLENSVNKPVVGVIPYIHSLGIDDEDSVSLERSSDNETNAIKNNHVDIVIIKLPRISNFTDFNMFTYEKDTRVRFVDNVGDIGNPDLLIIPGTKNTMGDLMFLREKGISEEALVKVQPLFNFTGTIHDKIAKLSVLLSSSEEGMKGVEELRFICDNISKLGLQKATLDLDVTLARGLNYYTGAIFEVAAPEGVAMGSIGGGGRYDNLVSMFQEAGKVTPCVGVSVGIERVFTLMESK